jgi:hypothetical protein
MFTSASNRALQINNKGCGSVGSFTMRRSLSVNGRLACAKISVALSGLLNTNLIIAQSAESTMDIDTILMSVISNQRTTRISPPTRFATNTLNCLTLGQSRPLAVRKPVELPDPSFFSLGMAILPC